MPLHSQTLILAAAAACGMTSNWLLAQAQPPAGLGPPGIAIGAGTIYISDIQHNLVMLRGADGTFRPFVQDPRIKSARGLAADRAYLYIADPVAHQVFRVDQSSRDVLTLLPSNADVAPIDVALVPTYFRDDKIERRTEKLAILDAKSNSVLLIDPTRPSAPISPASNQRFFKRPSSISQYGGALFLTDDLAGAIFQTNDASLGQWQDVHQKSLGSPDATRSSDTAGFFFPQFQRPASIAAYSDFYYVLDDGKLYAYLPKRDRLIPLANREHEAIRAQRVAVSQEPDQLILLGSDSGDYRSWPILIPITIEVLTQQNSSDAISAIYTYLNHNGFLPLTSVTTPLAGCLDVACLVEQARRLSPQMNTELERLFCELNAGLCSNSNIKPLPAGTKVTLPDVPYETSLSIASAVADGGSSILSYLERFVPNLALRQTINGAYISEINPGVSIRLDDVPTVGMTFQIPMQQNRYYLSVPKEELYSSSSGLAQLIGKYPAIRMTSFGTSGKAAPQATSVSEVAIQDPAKLVALQTDVLKHLGFNQDHRDRYGLGDDVPVLIAESSLDCQHPVFFGSGGPDDHSFSSGTCFNAASAHSSVYVEFSLSAPHHGTCVASIIGGRSSPYGQSLAPHADLGQIDDASIDVSSLVKFYRREKQPFVVNVSSGDQTITAASNWRTLLSNRFVQQEVLVVASADNDNAPLDNVQKYPAYLSNEFSNLVSVGALNRKGDSIWIQVPGQTGSNFGKKVDLLSPGEQVPCAEEVSQSQALYSSPSGTSFAAPLVSSVAALLLQKKLSPAEVKARLLATAEPVAIQLWGQPLSQFGRLSIDDALLSPKMAHLFFQTGNAPAYFSGDILESSVIKSRDPNALIPEWEIITLHKLLSIRREIMSPDGSPLYRIITSEGGVIGLKERVELDGCLFVDARSSEQKYIFTFGAGCPEQGTTESRKVVGGITKLVAPTVGVQ